MKKQELAMFSVSTLLLIFMCASSGIASDLISSDREALVMLRSTLHGRPLLWNLTASPCSWNGIVCYKNRVVELHLPGMGLSGRLPSNVIGNLTYLETLSLRFNSLTGPLPPDLANLTSLQNLYMQGNRFSGNLPPFLFSMHSLTRLDLASNNFTGEISPALNSLTRLEALYLEKNHLTGSIPNLTIQLHQLNVSYNQLSGRIPPSVSDMPESAFQGNSLCGKPLGSCEAMAAGRNKLSTEAIVGIVIGCLFTFLLSILIILAAVHCRRVIYSSTAVDMPALKHADARISGVKSSDDGITEYSISMSPTLAFFGKQEKRRLFDLEELLTAPAEVLGKGTFGTTYKAELVSGTSVAVKRLRDSETSIGVFEEKVEELGSMDHENLVPLRAFYLARDEKLLVSDYIPSGSLSSILHGDEGDHRTALGWSTRYNIALGVARGIGYIHSRGPTICHGNIKSSNVLLTEAYEARVSDYGLALLTAPRSRLHGYLPAADVTAATRIASQKADVYCFGVLIIELLTGKAPNGSRLEEESGLDLPRWVHSVVRHERISQVFDKELMRYEDYVDEGMVQLLQVAMECTALDPGKRPSMAEVKNRIEAISPSR
ncbi:hypothetical protein SAY86_029950 [Trapa natans]|uniref:Protein kinase domain-containing protein n=1 Tax=Trapa natans TaxID=22666 RepID=A0AAN7M4H2_TRANT|nr:hypothetical protein SAY86_029950 [Trapa natans]